MMNFTIFPYPVRGAGKLMVISAAALWMTSCASYKGIESSAHLRMPSDYETTSSLPAQGGLWPDSAWPKQLGGESLQTLVDEALADNPSMQTAAARIAAAAAATHAARAAGSPVIDASFKSTYQRYTENGIIPPPLGGTFNSDNTLTLNFSYDFDFWGRHTADLRSALAQEKVAEADQQAARLALTTSIAHGWLQLAREYAQLDLSRQQITVRQKIDHLTQLRFAAGLDTQTENQQAQQQLENLRAEEAQLTETIMLTRNQLAALLGKGPDRGQKIERPLLPQHTVMELPADLPLNLLGRRADLVAARWRVEAMQSDIQSAKAQFYPNINLTAFAGFSSLGLAELLDSGSRIVGVGPAIRVPIFGGGALRALCMKRRIKRNRCVPVSSSMFISMLPPKLPLTACNWRASANRSALPICCPCWRAKSHHWRSVEANLMPVSSALMPVSA